MYRDRVYEPADVRSILKRASDLQELPGAAPVESTSLTLAEIQALGAKAGIHADAIAAAAPGGPAVAARVPYLQTSVLRVVLRRLPWVALLVGTERVMDSLSRSFTGDFEKVFLLAVYVQLVLAAGANTGSQTTCTVIRALSLGELRAGDALRVVWREACAGLALGVVLGGVALGLVWRRGHPHDLAVCVGVSVLAGCTWANAVSGVVPIVMHRLRVDPAVSSVPIITRIIDASGMVFYVLLARLMLAKLHGG
jgi:magnesium transporter